MDYREIKTKRGNLVFCNFDELLTEAYGIKSMEEVTKFAKGDEYIIHCPFCKEEGHTKHKLYVKTDLTVGHCFVCCRNFMNVTDRVDVTYKLPKTFAKFSGTADSHQLIKLAETSENPDEWTLDRFNYEFDDYDAGGVEYLKSRHQFMEELYPILGFKFLDGNVVMPFYYRNELIYYQIRFTGNSSIRYYFPPIAAKPPFIINRNVPEPRLIICEGVYDAIACMIMAPQYIPVAVLGSSVSDYQLEFIREYVPTEIVVYMDKTDISIRIAEKLKTVIDYCPINIIKSSGQDPEEKMKEILNHGGAYLQWIRPIENINKVQFRGYVNNLGGSFGQ